jgi:hypothetical protein
MWEGLFAITRILTAIITGILGPFIIWWIKEEYGEEKRENEVNKTISEEVKFAQDINEELGSIRNEIDGDRVWIAQFHNGGKILNLPRKASMKRISVTHEVTAPGVSKERRKLNDILVSFFSEIINTLIRTDHVVYNDEDDDLEPEIKLIFRERGNEQMHLFAMRDIDGVLIGIMGADFTDKKKYLSQQEVQYLKVKANLLAGYVIHGQVKQNQK